jgi:hypothetical protein
MRLELSLCAMLLALASIVGCGSKKIGEECDKPGATDVCESGGVCTKDTSNATRCLKICQQQTDCASNEECNGVEGSSLKACRIKK